MDRGYMLRAIPMSVTAKFTVSSSGAFSRLRRRAALKRTDALPRTDRRAAGSEVGEKKELSLIWVGKFSQILLIFNSTGYKGSQNGNNASLLQTHIRKRDPAKMSLFFLWCLLNCNLSEASCASCRLKDVQNIITKIAPLKRLF